MLSNIAPGVGVTLILHGHRLPAMLYPCNNMTTLIYESYKTVTCLPIGTWGTKFNFRNSTAEPQYNNEYGYCCYMVELHTHGTASFIDTYETKTINHIISYSSADPATGFSDFLTAYTHPSVV